MRVFARRERPHPGAQLTLFEADDGWRYSLWATNRPADTRGWLGQPAYIDVAHRVQARVEDAIRTGKDAAWAISPPLSLAILRLSLTCMTRLLSAVPLVEDVVILPCPSRR